ncbi:zinc finger protein [Histomonas meleagridis]|uniref:zinc finger protein n=1 Tax=Histomonas meleagridis TaxID=135588 RepID=UPI00355A1D02|nr:zinc finger protein [Histomonas meleagridis]KAH0803680.1 zinc finger protein [Histomonas meleagridis]
MQDLFAGTPYDIAQTERIRNDILDLTRAFRQMNVSLDTSINPPLIQISGPISITSQEKEYELPVVLTLPSGFPNCEPIVRIPLPLHTSLKKKNFQPNGVLNQGVISYSQNSSLSDFLIILIEYFNSHPPVGFVDANLILRNFLSTTRLQTPPTPHINPNPPPKPQPKQLTAIPDDYMCPVCYEIMKRPDHVPMILFPCGHTACKSCIDSYQNKSGHKRCCLCNQEFQNYATNYNLLHLIENDEIPNQFQAQTNQLDKYHKKFNEKKEKMFLYFEQQNKLKNQLKDMKDEIQNQRKTVNSLEDELKRINTELVLQKTKLSELNMKKGATKEQIQELNEILKKLVPKVQKYEALSNAQNSVHPT